MYQPTSTPPDMPSGNGKADTYSLKCADCDWKIVRQPIQIAGGAARQHHAATGHTILYKGHPQVFSR